MDHPHANKNLIALQKICGRCQSSFQCCASDIAQCACSKINISGKEIEYLLHQYKDCLCVKCLQESAEQYLPAHND